MNPVYSRLPGAAHCVARARRRYSDGRAPSPSIGLLARPVVLALVALVSVACGAPAEEGGNGVGADSALPQDTGAGDLGLDSQDGGATDANVGSEVLDASDLSDLPAETDIEAVTETAVSDSAASDAESTDAEASDAEDAGAGDAAADQTDAAAADAIAQTDAAAGSDADAVTALPLCRPCMSNDDCAVGVPVPGAICHPISESEGSFCIAPCGSGCPAGYSCQGLSGQPGSYCVPDSTVCACDQAAKAVGLWTTCTTTNVSGTCQGKRTCGAQALGSCDAPQASAEVCDNIDNDCDGQTDNGITGIPTSCGKGGCSAKGELGCKAGEWVDSCVALAPAATDTSCDGVDNDCNGQTDESYVDQPTTCGVGLCTSLGKLVCQAGKQKDTCKPLPPALADLTCNGFDDDCNGQTDEDYVPKPVSCGTGACATTGQTACVQGKVQDVCTPLLGGPDDASCDAVDDDCDGQTDEDYAGMTTYCGEGVCATSGETSCVAGEIVDSCVDLSPAASDSTCNGIDNDCDGVTDEDYLPEVSKCGQGACVAAGLTACVDGKLQDSCTPLTAAANDAACDGVDNDCDGQTDEDFVPAATQCGTGACVAAGMTSCVDGKLQDSCTPGTAAATDTTCDGVDDNCNGKTDDGYVTKASFCGKGQCAAVGFVSCVAGQLKDSCNPAPAAANDAQCDGVDNDCNGETDEDFVVTVTTCGKGACQASGQTSCVNGVPGNSCVALPPGPNDVLCDGIDNDCSGQTDEDYVPQNTTCGTGACKATGSTSCVAGKVKDSCMPFPGAQQDAICDNVDNDCNGQTDEDYVSVPTQCGLGACVSSGMSSCQGGQVKTNCTPLPPAGKDESCDGVDNDCNGQTDEDYQIRVTTCGSGGCASWGETSCKNGQELDDCVPGDPGNLDNNCNGRDDNCNGQTDEAFAPAPTQCGTGECVATSISSCVNGKEQSNCVPKPAGADDMSCDNKDNNCNGLTDEGYVKLNTNCGTGVCARQGNTVCAAGQVQDTCVEGLPSGNDANCDNMDNNCNGQTDEGYIPVGTTCGLGICVASGQTYCEGGSVKSNCKPGTPAADDSSCNKTDDDCNGQTDEDYVTANTTCGIGACAAEGLRICVNGKEQDSCLPNEAAPDDSVCNLQDDDCDGDTDEEFAPQATNCGAGACGAVGITMCDGGAVEDTCVPLPPGPSDNTCNNVDENCNGVTDEGYNGGTVTCGVGSCLAAGFIACVGGAPTPVCNPLPAQGADNNCDLVDNDCDGQTDEDYPDLNVTCGSGVCQRSGKQLCVAGQLVNTCVPGAAAASDATCNNVDDNCNGQTDEEYPETPTTCGLGVCKETGVIKCENGQVTNSCVPKVGSPSDTSCNKTDDDCDGSTDEDFVQEPQTCGVGGCQRTGKLVCNNGLVSTTCFPGVPGPQEEICNGVDDDCNGQTDENYQACNCPPDANFTANRAKTCATAENLGEMADTGSSVVRNGTLSISETGDWYMFYAKDTSDTTTGCDKFNVVIQLTQNPGDQYALTVYRGNQCIEEQSWCSGVNLSSWGTNFYGDAPFGPDSLGNPSAIFGLPQLNGPGSHVPSPQPERAGECKCRATPGIPGENVCTDNSSWFQVRVYRKTNTTATCAAYQLSISNGTQPIIKP